MFKCLLVASFASLAFLAGCANKACCDTGDAAVQKTADGNIVVVNTMCPIGGDDFGSKERSPDLARSHGGTSIGFCCDGCVKSFDKMSDEKKAEVAAAAKANKTL